MSKWYLFLFQLSLLSLGLWSGGAALASEPPVARSVEELEARITHILENHQVPGLSGAIVYGDEVIWQGALGLADLESQRPVTDETLFRVGSISKTFVSLAVLKLVERGELSLDDLISELAPKAGVVNKWDSQHPVRLAHVLEHTAGFDDIHLRDYAWQAPEATTREGIDYNTTSRHARWEPGTRMSYSNIGPPIAALTLENKTGERFEDLVQKEILDALGMQTATFFYDPAVAKSYGPNGQEAPYHHLGVRSSGALNASSGDMIQLLRMFNQRGKVHGHPLIQPQSLDRMERPATTLAAQNGLEVGYGLGNYGTQMRGFVFQGHGGAISGFLSQFAYLPGEGRGYFFSINQRHGEAFKQIEAEITAFLCQDLSAPRPTPTVELTEAELKTYEGLYQLDASRAEIIGSFQRLIFLKVHAQDGILSIHSPLTSGPRQSLAPVGEHQFIREGNARPSLIFVKGPNGENLAQYEGLSLRKISPLLAYGRITALLLCLLFVLSAFAAAPFWSLSWIVGNEEIGHFLPIRVLPLLTSTVLALGVYLLMAGTAAGAMAEISLYSVAFWLSSLVYSGLTGLTLVYTLLQFSERKRMGFWTWCHAACVAWGLFGINLFLSVAGFIGLQTWAY
jgi:CubicO group peptidase (beta-lactamase class C family)